MINVSFSALGEIKKYLPQETEVELRESKKLGDILNDELRIPKKETRLCCVVNGKIQRMHYEPNDCDKIVVMRVGGAG